VQTLLFAVPDGREGRHHQDIREDETGPEPFVGDIEEFREAWTGVSIDGSGW
jgi:hypothetical protein